MRCPLLKGRAKAMVIVASRVESRALLNSTDQDKLVYVNNLIKENCSNPKR